MGGGGLGLGLKRLGLGVWGFVVSFSYVSSSLLCSVFGRSAVGSEVKGIRRAPFWQMYILFGFLFGSIQVLGFPCPYRFLGLGGHGLRCSPLCEQSLTGIVVTLNPKP